MIGFCPFQTQTFQLVNTNIVKIQIILFQGKLFAESFPVFFFSVGWKELRVDMRQDRSSVLSNREIIWIPPKQLRYFTYAYDVNWHTYNRYKYAFPGPSPNLLYLPKMKHFQSFNRSWNLTSRENHEPTNNPGTVSSLTN